MKTNTEEMKAEKDKNRLTDITEEELKELEKGGAKITRIDYRNQDNQKKTAEHLSDCCQASVKVVGGDEGTNHWDCEKCGESCNDTFYQQNNQINK